MYEVCDVLAAGRVREEGRGGPGGGAAHCVCGLWFSSYHYSSLILPTVTLVFPFCSACLSISSRDRSLLDRMLAETNRSDIVFFFFFAKRRSCRLTPGFAWKISHLSNSNTRIHKFYFW